MRRTCRGRNRRRWEAWAIFFYVLSLALAPLAVNAQTIPTALGWTAMPNTKLRGVCPDPAQFPNLQMAAHDCSGETADWDGGALDSKRSRLLIRGGGHNGYWGNEMYALDIAAQTITRLENPSDYPSGFFAACQWGAYLAPGTSDTPSASQGYNHLAYIPDSDQWFEWGSVAPPCGGFTKMTMLRDLATMAWHDKTKTASGPAGGAQSGAGPTEGFGRGARYDPNTHLIFMRDDFNLWTYDPAANAYSQFESGNVAVGSGYKTAVIDPKRKLYLIYENTTGWHKVSIASAPYPDAQPWAVTGCGSLDYSMGIEYDPVLDRVVMWNGGDTVWLLNADTSSCSSMAFAGGPAAAANGTFGRFRYVPAYNVYVVVNSVDDNAYFLRLSSGGTVVNYMPPAKPGGLALK